MLKEKSYARGTHPDLPPPISEVGIVGGAGRTCSLHLQIRFLRYWPFMLYSIVPGLIQWAFIDAIYVAENRDECWN